MFGGYRDGKCEIKWGEYYGEEGGGPEGWTAVVLANEVAPPLYSSGEYESSEEGSYVVDS